MGCKPFVGVKDPLSLCQTWKMWNHTVCQQRPENQNPITVAIVTLPSNRTVATALGAPFSACQKLSVIIGTFVPLFLIGFNDSPFTAWRNAGRAVGMAMAEVNYCLTCVCVYVFVYTHV